MCDCVGCQTPGGETFWRTGRTYCFEHAPLHCRTVHRDGTRCQSQLLHKLFEDRKRHIRAYLCDVCHETTVLPL